MTEGSLFYKDMNIWGKIMHNYEAIKFEIGDFEEWSVIEKETNATEQTRVLFEQFQTAGRLKDLGTALETIVTMKKTVRAM